VLAWVALVSWASTGTWSADQTSQIIVPWLRRLFPHMSLDTALWLHTIIRKSAHVTEYAIFALLAARALVTSSRRWLSRAWLPWSVLLVVAMAAVDEYHQSFVPGRTAAVGDVALDICGGLAALSAMTTWRWLARWEGRRRLWNFGNCPEP
jgi:hypothetical protein